MTVRAVQADRPGGPEVLEVREVLCTQTGPGQVLVRTVASSLNPIDRKMRGRESLTFPLTLGWDLAGLVVESDVARFRRGNRVIAMTDPLVTGIGAWSDLVALDADVLAFAPDRAALSRGRDAAARRARRAAGMEQAVAGTIVEGAGGRRCRCDRRLPGPARRPGRPRRRRPGLASVPPGHGQGASALKLVTDDPEALPEHGYNAIVDTVGLTATLGRFVAADGHYVVTSKEQPDLPRSHSVRVAADAAQLGQLARMVDAGELRLRVAAHYGLYDVHDAHWHFEAGGLLGKVVLAF